jgi:hypothetical protein
MWFKTVKGVGPKSTNYIKFQEDMDTIEKLVDWLFKMNYPKCDYCCRGKNNNGTCDSESIQTCKDEVKAYLEKEVEE